ncbi:MAG: type II CRISPR RNA-guided endonuclease Cas9, partial [Bacteroidales bacterium]|nr:type II CRISPR RNA-guided endonuclease Cas9 [Bacteroidales bacterium]
MKKILGLDLGTNSIGWAVVNEAENNEEKSSIVKLGVRINPLTVDELSNFEKGKSITTNADRTLKRSMRRNLQRYKLRRENLIEILKDNGFISDETILSETGNATTFQTYRLRAKAATGEISLEKFARVLLMINKKRGYKSSRKAKGSEEGSLIDGMDVAKKLYEENLTPGQYCLELLQNGKKYLPDFYRSDLQNEFDRVWKKQNEFYPDILTDELHDELTGKKRDAVYAICVKHFIWNETHTIWNEEKAINEQVQKEHTIVGFKRNGNTNEQKIENLQWRVNGLSGKLQLEELVVVLQEINTKINGSSGYLGAISDRSKELYFKKQTVGQYQMAVLNNNPNASLRNMVFYRQDYLDEFEKLWETQKQFHSELAEELKSEIRDIVIFYQRRLKSQKGLISFCEFESRQIEVEIDGKKKIKTVGSRVIPRSSPLFQEFKIWQILNNIEVSVNGKKAKKNKKDQSPTLFDDTDIDKLEIEGHRPLYQEEKAILANELFIRDKMSKSDALKLLFNNSQELDLNFKTIDGNRTVNTLFQAYGKIIEMSGHNPIDFKQPTEEIIDYVKTIFNGLGWNTDVLTFDPAKELDAQPFYKLWHLLYSFEGDNSKTGNENLINKLMRDYGLDKDSAKLLANVTFLDDYGSLSAKAIRKILPYLKEGNGYDVACVYAGYEKHSKSSLTKEEIRNKILKEHLDILPKNTLRNPVVEKILNQMVNVINQLVDEYGTPDENGEKHFDEIRVELARELKKNAKEREELTKSINDNSKLYENYRKELAEAPYNLSHVSRNDIIRYKLWQEMKANGYKTLYSNTYISPAEIFSGKFDIEHIIPQARLFDDSFSNKTLELRDVNLKKGNKTAYDFVKDEYGEKGLEEFLIRVERLYNLKSRIDDNEETKTAATISKGKYNKLKMSEADIPDGFINRDLRNTQYIAKKALEMLNEITRRVVATSGSVTDELRKDWGLIDIMKELNWDKYNALGMTEVIESKRLDDQGREKTNRIYRIKDWSKRNDHRHHAMDALTVAFTQDVFIQYFNNKNASFKANTNEYAIKNKYFENTKAIAPMPLNEFRAEAKRQLE